MTNDINFLTGIKDPHLKPDKPYLSKKHEVTVVHLIQSYPMRCPHCGRLMKRNGFRVRNVIVKILPVAGCPAVLSIRKQKYICPPSADCPQTITRVARVKGINDGCRIANVVKYHITEELSESVSMKVIAQHHNVSTNTVIRQLTPLETNLKPNRHWLPSTIAFDDFKSGQFAQSGMSMVLMNPMNHRTIDIIQSRRDRYLRSYFLSHYSQQARWSVRIVVVDLFEPYRHLIHDVFPKAVIVADHFHVIIQAYRALQRVRIKVMNQYGKGSHAYRALKHYWKLLMTKTNQLDYLHYYSRRNFRYTWLSNSEVVDRLLNFSSELETAYNFYQQLILAIEKGQQKLLDQLIHQKPSTLPWALKAVRRTLAKHRSEILASFDTHLTNGPIEGTNNKIKVIKRIAYGYRNFFHFRVRILLALKNSNIMIKNLPKRKTRPMPLVA